MGIDINLLTNFDGSIFLASTDPATIANNYGAALNKIIQKLLVGDGSSMTDTFWGAIVSPFKLIAGVGVLFWIVPVLPDLSYDFLKNNTLKILTLLLITFFFVNDAYAARVFAIGNYAMIRGIDAEIAANTKLIIGANAEVTAIKTDSDTIKAISNQVRVCIDIPKTVDDSDPAKLGNQIPNQTYIDCNRDLKAMIGAAKTSVKSPDLANDLATAEAGLSTDNGNFDFGKGVRDLMKIFAEPEKWLKDQFLSLVLDGWTSALADTVQEGMILSIIALPIPLAFSFMNTKPLINWFASLWGLGIFKFSLTFLGALIGFIGANMAGSLPAYSLQFSYAIGAPIIAGLIATGGGVGILQLMAQLSSEMAGLLKGGVK
ncbi:hypothetical protein [Chamaesiphon sp.]|uniref:hypothetical protein n=1 Tax=Chamaesiphon sp. TaxID=2814140 RepID=UPI00359450BB